MQLNNTSQYAIRILSFLANHEAQKLFSAKELSLTLHIPYKFLTKIMTDLVKAHFVISIRGREGGFKLAKKSSQITLMEVLHTFNQCNEENECLLGIGKCDLTNKCALHDQWEKPKSMIENMFKNTTLENLEGNEFKI